MNSITFTIPGIPVAKGRPKFARRGAFVSAYTPEKTASYENLVKVVAQQSMHGRVLLDGPVSVVIWLYVSPPASWSKKKQADALASATYPTSKPDMDNVVKGIFDACNSIVWVDDKQVVDLFCGKRFAVTPCATVEVEAVCPR